MKLKLSRKKINIAMASSRLSVATLAELYGVSRNRMSVILNSCEVTPICAGRLSDALNVAVSEILED